MSEELESGTRKTAVTANEHAGKLFLQALTREDWEQRQARGQGQAGLDHPNKLLLVPQQDGDKGNGDKGKKQEPLPNIELIDFRELLKKSKLAQGVIVDPEAAENAAKFESMIKYGKTCLPEKSATPDQVAQLIAKLGSPVFKEREAADQELALLGPLAVKQLASAATSPDSEVRIRAADLLQRSKSEKIPSIDAIQFDSVNKEVRGDVEFVSLNIEATRDKLRSLVTTLNDYDTHPEKVKARLAGLASLFEADKDKSIVLTDIKREALTHEVLALADIKKELAAVHLELAGYAGHLMKGNGSVAEVKANLLAAIANDPKIVEDHYFFNVVYLNNLQNDAKFMSSFDEKSKFMADYKAVGGSEIKLKEMIASSEEQSGVGKKKDDEIPPPPVPLPPIPEPVEAVPPRKHMPAPVPDLRPDFPDNGRLGF